MQRKAKKGSKSNPRVLPPKKSPQLSLDDVAALLAQLEPTDLPDLARVREALNDLATGGASSALVQSIVVETLQKVDDLMQGRASDPGSVLTDVGRLIDIATDAMEEDRPEEISQPAPVEPSSPPAAAARTDLKPSPPVQASPTEPAAVGKLPAQTESAAWPDQLPPGGDPSLLAEFLTESRDCIEGAEAALLSLETAPDNLEAVNTVFRAFHTIKGTSAFLGLSGISELAHLAESLLSRVRDHEIRCTGGYADLALRSVDMFKELTQAVQDALGGEPMIQPEGYGDLLGLLADPEAAGISDESNQIVGATPRLGDILVAEGKAKREEVELAAADQGEQALGVALVRSETAPLTDVAKALRTQRRMAGGEQAAESSVRVRTDSLDRLIDMVGELVIAHSLVAQDETVVNSGRYELIRKVTHTGKIVRELQDLSMSMRMVPLKTTFQKMVRLVRDLARKNGKLVELITEGEDTEIDRNMVSGLNDPLVHMVRNAVDHGIELPEVRETNGKPRIGTVRLSAYHSGGSVVVEAQDDGRGLARDKIVKKALAKGLIESDRGMSDSEVFNLIFTPGFSTADKVTDISGRGVGLDVVKRNVEALRGRIDISSEVGRGCTFSLRLPLTLAITDGILVKVGAERYAMPTVNIHMSFRPDAGALSTIAGRGEMVMFHGEAMPVFRLHRLFDIAGAVEDPTRGLLVVVGDGNRRYALLVDELLGKQQMVAKSLGNGLGKVQGISGGAILGDGRVGIILDPAEIAALARQEPVASKGEGVAASLAA